MAGSVCLVPSVPKCAWCDAPGEFDFPTIFGPWANGCGEHFLAYSTSGGELGVGKGQLWIKKEEA